MPKIAPWAFVLAVPDFNRSAAYFRDILGFRILWEEGTDWRLAERDGVRIMLGHCPNATPPSEIGRTIGLAISVPAMSMPCTAN